MTLTQINKAGLDEIALDHVFTIGASGNSAYTFQGEGLNGTVNNPTLYLTRGKTYRFENGTGGHPIRIQSTSGASGTAYNTGVTNNASAGTVIVEVQHDAPDVLYYQCTSHAAMNGILYITGALADGGVTTAKIAADAVTNAKIANGAVDSEHLATGIINNSNLFDGAVVNTAQIVNNAVTTNEIADNTIPESKLKVSNSPTNGYFLSAQSGNTGGLTWAQVNTDLSNDGSPQLGAALDTNGYNINFGDSTGNGNAVNRLTFGTKVHGDLQIYHDGSNSYITDRGTGELRLYAAETLRIRDTDSGEEMITCNKNGSVDLYHNNVKKFETTANGVKIASLLDIKPSTYTNIEDESAYGLNIKHVNEKPISIATGGDYIQLYDLTSSKMYIKCLHDSGVELYQNGGKRLETVAAGVNIVGNLGIGDTSPDYEIDIETASPHIRLEETSTGASKRLDLGVSAAGQPYIAANQSSNSIQFETTGARRFLINANGTINSQAASSGPNLSTMSNNALEQPHNQFSNSQTYSWNSVFRNHSAGYGIEIKVNDGSNSREGLHLYSTSASQSKASILMNGAFLSRADDYAGYSDIKLKENIVDAQSQWNDVKAVKVRNFNFKDNPDVKLLGVVAQELETVCPHLIHNLPDKETNEETGEIKETGTITKAAKYSILHMKAFKALQEAMARIEILETKVAVLEAA